ncbi:MAG: EscU/YscU/HrcU family type III secretion system export apparatus switch protein [Rhodomicrobium sp.]
MTDTNKGEAKRKVAVALQYEPGKDKVPRLTAKGHGEVAAKIVELAETAGVHVERNEPLAKALSQLDLDQRIPKELYRAVAEVVGFVLKKAGQIQNIPRG